MAIFCMGEASCVCGWWNFLVIVRSYYTLRGRKMQLRTRKDKGRGLAKKGGGRVRRGLCADSLSGESSLASLRGLAGRRCGCFQGGVAVFFGAARMFTASLSVAKPPPSRREARGARPQGRRRRSLRSLSAGEGWGILGGTACDGRAAGGRFAPWPPGRGWTVRFDGRLGRRAEALAVRLRLL